MSSPAPPAPPVSGSADYDDPGHPDERVPGGSRPPAGGRSLLERVRGRRTKPATTAAPHSRPPAVRRGPRRSLARGAEAVYYRIGRAVVGTNSPTWVPAARAAQLFAPAAGHHWDALLAGTWFDRRVGQPLAERSEATKAVVASICFPAAVLLATLRPELWPMLRPELEDMLEENIISMGPALRVKARRKKEMQKTLDDMAAEGLLPVGTTAGELLESIIFAPLGDEPLPPEEPPAYFVRVVDAEANPVSSAAAS